MELDRRGRQGGDRARGLGKHICVCTDDRDADDLLMFGQDWGVREAIRLGVPPLTAWSMGSLHGANRFAMDGEIGGLGGGRRADLVLLDDDLKPHTTWYGGTRREGPDRHPSSMRRSRRATATRRPPTRPSRSGRAETGA
jgi:adenine deaminase